MRGAMIDLIIRRKTVESGLSLTANSGAYMPTSTPTTMEMRIHVVRDSRFTCRIIALLSGICSRSDRWRWPDGHRPRATPQRGITEAVNDIKHETDHQPPAEPHPRQVWQASHDENAEQSSDDTDEVDERHPERPRPFRICITQHDYP